MPGRPSLIFSLILHHLIEAGGKGWGGLGQGFKGSLAFCWHTPPLVPLFPPLEARLLGS